MKKHKIAYNPYLTIAENAKNNRVSDATIRMYIKINGLDRQGDNAIIIQREIKNLLKKEPNLSQRELARRLNHSVNTIRKYLKNVSFNDKTKLSTLDTSKQKTLISSVSQRQEEILNNILRLYIPSFKFDCDITYSVGEFYRRIPEPTLKFDKYPQTADTLPLEDAYELPSQSLSSIVMDLPFIICNNKESDTFPKKVHIADRFSYYSSPQDLYQTNLEMLDLVYDKLKKGGILVAKTQDTIFAGKQHWVHNFLVNNATEKGFELIDTFVLIAKTRMIRSKEYVQKHARKYHSYFLVFQKKK